MDRLTPVEREDLYSTLAAIRALGPALDRDRAAARQIADAARRALPDVDEVTIGRVLLLVSASLPQLRGAGHDLRSAENILALSAARLTVPDGAESL